jgi:hypothetical protein
MGRQVGDVDELALDRESTGEKTARRERSASSLAHSKGRRAKAAYELNVGRAPFL